METALFKCGVEDVVMKLREILARHGFQITPFDDKNKIVKAFRYGNWFRRPEYLLFEFSGMRNSLTRVDITASIERKKKRRRAEEMMEEKIATIMYRHF